MSTIHLTDPRRVIPNWRSYKTTFQLGELALNKNTTNSSVFSKEDISESLGAWRNKRTLGTASDLLSNAYVTQLTDLVDVKKAAKFIVCHKNSLPNPICDIATKILNSNIKNNTFLNIETISELNTLHNENYIHKRISKLKSSAIEFPRNSITKVEMARLYSLLGQYNQASQAMKTAIKISPDNRFIIRSACRLFVHIGEIKFAHNSIKNSTIVNKDPWVMSTEIAIATIRGKNSRYVNKGRSIINSLEYSPFDISELCSSLATIEFINGAHKKSRKLFYNSLKDPNDNSLAQYQWASNNDKRIFVNIKIKKIKNPFEALSLKHYYSGKWEEAVQFAIKWFLDMPYSKRPVIFGSFIATTYLDKYSLAEELCRAGLYANPNNPKLINNLSFSLASNNKPDKAHEIINRVSLNDKLDISDKISIEATKGLIHFRLGQVGKGRHHYRKSIRFAETYNEHFYRTLAYLNFLKEEVTFSKDSEESKNLIINLDKYISNNSNKHLIWLKDKILSKTKYASE